MLILRLLGSAVMFALRNSWPIVAFGAVFVPVQFVLDNFGEALLPLIGKNALLAGPVLLVYIVFYSLLSALYTAALYLIIWTRLINKRFDYALYRDTLRPVFGRFFVLMIILNMVSMSWVLLPFLVFIPYVAIVVLFEKPGLKQAFRRNFHLFGLQPIPALACGLLLVFLLGWAPSFMMTSEISEAFRYLYSYSMTIITLPVDVCFLVLFYTLTSGRPPADFPDLTPEDKEF